MSPAGQVDIMSTHDQVLGGAHGQTYFGCHFPADPEYAALIAARGLKVGRRLAREGVIGRAAVDFVAVRRTALGALRARNQPALRRHDASAVRAHEPHGRRLRPARRRVAHAPGDIKHYAATDHLDSPAYRSLTPDDLLDVVADRGLGWDGEREVGVVLHMVSAIAVAGRIGLTAIGDTLDEARQRYYGVKAAVDVAAQDPRAQRTRRSGTRLAHGHLGHILSLDGPHRRAACVDTRSRCRRGSSPALLWAMR